MYIERKALKDVPEGAIIISEDEALEHYHNNIFKGKHGSPIWPLKFGFLAVSAVSFVSNYWIVHSYRRRLKLTGFPLKLAANIGFVCMPTAFAGVAHFVYCTDPILLESMCTMCVYSRSILMQSLFGVFYGVVPSGILLVLLAAVRLTYPVPGFTSVQDTKETMKIWLKFTKRIRGGLLSCILFNAASLSMITYGEIKSAKKLRKIMQEQDLKLREFVEDFRRENSAKT